jgi:hypothetical protein
VREIELSSFQRPDDELVGIVVVEVEHDAVHAQEHVGRRERDALVPIDEGMVLGDAEPVGGGELSKVRVWFVVVPVSRSLEGGLEESPIT